MSLECRVSTFERDTRHSRDAQYDARQSCDSQYDISRECRPSALKSHDILKTHDILATLNTIYRANIAQLSLVDLKTPRSTHDILSTLNTTRDNHATINIWVSHIALGFRKKIAENLDCRLICRASYWASRECRENVARMSCVDLRARHSLDARQISRQSIWYIARMSPVDLKITRHSLNARHSLDVQYDISSQYRAIVACRPVWE
jgi:hypothetical protein